MVIIIAASWSACDILLNALLLFLTPAAAAAAGYGEKPYELHQLDFRLFTSVSSYSSCFCCSGEGWNAALSDGHWGNAVGLEAQRRVTILGQMI